MTSSEKPPFDLDALVQGLRGVAHKADAASQVKGIMERVFSDAESIASHMPEFVEDDVILFEDDSISIWHCRFQPGKAVPPHNHEMMATIGVYVGVERNDYYKSSGGDRIQPSKAVEMSMGSVVQMGPSAIHSVVCTSTVPSCGIHVYLGPLSTIDRDLYNLKTNEKMLFTDETYYSIIAQA